MSAPKKKVQAISRTPRYTEHGRPINNLCVLSLDIVRAWNVGKFNDSQAKIMVNLASLQFGEVTLSAVRESVSELAERMNMARSSVETQLKEIINRCGNADPEWVEKHGKCAKNKCSCPKMLAIVKDGNVNAYRVNSANVALAPRYVQPKLAEVPKRAITGESGGDPVSVAPGKRWSVPFSPVDEGVKEWEFLNEDDLPLAFVVTRQAHKCTTRIKRLEAISRTPGIVPAGRDDKKANTVEHSKVTGFRPPSRLTELPITHIIVQPLEEALDGLRLQEWPQEDFSPAFVLKIAAALGETPLENFTALAHRDLALRKNRHQEGPLRGATRHPSAILIAYAGQASRAWLQGSPARGKAAAEVAQRQSEAVAQADFEIAGDETAWPEIRESIRKAVSHEQFENWFALTRGEGISDKGTLLVAVPGDSEARVLSEEYQELVNRKAAVHVGIERVQFWGVKSPAVGQ